MDVMACSISRSGNYQPELASAQAIFPDRECCVCLGRDPAIYFPIGKLKVSLASKIDTHLHPIWRGWVRFSTNTPRLSGFCRMSLDSNRKQHRQLACGMGGVAWADGGMSPWHNYGTGYSTMGANPAAFARFCKCWSKVRKAWQRPERARWSASAKSSPC